MDDLSVGKDDVCTRSIGIVSGGHAREGAGGSRRRPRSTSEGLVGRAVVLALVVLAAVTLDSRGRVVAVELDDGLVIADLGVR